MQFSRKEHLKWIAMPSSRPSSSPRDWPRVSCIAGRFFTIWATREAQIGILKKKTWYTEESVLTAVLSFHWGYWMISLTDKGTTTYLVNKTIWKHIVSRYCYYNTPQSLVFIVIKWCISQRFHLPNSLLSKTVLLSSPWRYNTHILKIY